MDNFECLVEPTSNKILPKMTEKLRQEIVSINHCRISDYCIDLVTYGRSTHKKDDKVRPKKADRFIKEKVKIIEILSREITIDERIIELKPYLRREQMEFLHDKSDYHRTSIKQGIIDEDDVESFRIHIISCICKFLLEYNIDPMKDLTQDICFNANSYKERVIDVNNSIYYVDRDISVKMHVNDLKYYTMLVDKYGSEGLVPIDEDITGLLKDVYKYARIDVSDYLISYEDLKMVSTDVYSDETASDKDTKSESISSDTSTKTNEVKVIHPRLVKLSLDREHDTRVKNNKEDREMFRIHVLSHILAFLIENDIDEDIMKDVGFTSGSNYMDKKKSMYYYNSSLSVKIPCKYTSNYDLMNVEMSHQNIMKRVYRISQILE
jgi:hypothetical protein